MFEPVPVCTDLFVTLKCCMGQSPGEQPPMVPQRTGTRAHMSIHSSPPTRTYGHSTNRSGAEGGGCELSTYIAGLVDMSRRAMAVTCHAPTSGRFPPYQFPIDQGVSGSEAKVV